jgi:hypothetical protein
MRNISSFGSLAANISGIHLFVLVVACINMFIFFFLEPVKALSVSISHPAIYTFTINN